MGFHGVPWGSMGMCRDSLGEAVADQTAGYHWNQFVVTLVICHIDPHAIYHGIYHAIYHGKHHGTP